MDYKDLLEIYITILIGCLTALTIVVSILKDEVLGKNFREVIQLLSKNNSRLHLLGGLQIIWNIVVYFIVVFYSAFLNELFVTNITFLKNEIFVFLGRGIVFLLIIHLVREIYIIAKYFMSVYSKMIQLNAGSKVDVLDEAWQTVLEQAIKDSRTCEHYETLAKNIKVGNIDSETINKLLCEGTMISETEPIESYASRKRYLLVRKYLKNNLINKVSNKLLNSRDYELIGYYDDIQNMDELKLDNITSDELSALIDGFTSKMRIDLQRGVSIYESQDNIRSIIDYLRNLESCDKRKGAGFVSLLKNTLPYPEFTKETLIMDCLFQLLFRSYEARLFFEGYARAVEGGLFVESFYKEINVKNNSNNNFDENFKKYITSQAKKIETFDPLYTYYNSGFVSGYNYLSYHNEKPKDQKITTKIPNIYETHFKLLCDYLEDANNSITENSIKIIYKRAKRIKDRKAIMDVIENRFAEIESFSYMKEVVYLKSLRDKK